jgi:hypothetical protein
MTIFFSAPADSSRDKILSCAVAHSACFRHAEARPWWPCGNSKEISMTNPDVTIAYEKHQQLLKIAAIRNKQVIFDALEAAGITTVAVTFDGEGDSGQIQDVSAKNGDDGVSLPAVNIQFLQVPWSTEEPQSEELSLRKAVKDLCWDYLSDEHGGWENNDGGFGEFTLDVAKREVQLDLNARFSDYTSYTHTF